MPKLHLEIMTHIKGLYACQQKTTYHASGDGVPGGPCDSGGHGETQVPSAGEQPEADRFRLHHKRVGREKENGGPIFQGPAMFRSHEEDEEAFGSKKTMCPTRPRQRI